MDPNKMTGAQTAFYKKLKEDGGWYNCEATICKVCGRVVSGTK